MDFIQTGTISVLIAFVTTMLTNYLMKPRSNSEYITKLLVEIIDDIGNAACREILTFEDTRRLERAVLRYPLIAKNRVDWDDFVRHGNARNFNYAMEVAKTRLREHLGLPTVHQNLMIYRHEGSSSPADKNSAG